MLMIFMQMENFWLLQIQDIFPVKLPADFAEYLLLFLHKMELVVLLQNLNQNTGNKIKKN